MEGKIIKILSNDYTVLSNQKKYLCKSRGKFRNMKVTPLVGDQVIFDENKLYILDILPRKNELLRPPVSNIYQAFILTSLKEPDFSSNLLDKLLIHITFRNIKPIICFSKYDLLDENEKKEMDKIMNYYKTIGYEVVLNTEIEKIKSLLENKTTVFTGQSGSGKSTLLNNIDSRLMLKTNEISQALGRGKHTTRHVEFLQINNFLVADTPGFSSINFEGMSDIDIKRQMIDFLPYEHLCKYKDCMHDKEEECGVKEKVEQNKILRSRYDNYLKFINGRERKYESIGFNSRNKR